ncbi:cyanoexosortase A [Aetokthonos hydrillicola Thurmond2011]|jgi:cyanoexosortase A|uniref:Cyanoexosortase A n=1 Tax=Aetokthonos hydrillicola Thurmond2011 TaxID=2712845 RepID=A0AAP5MAF2_9CYAN|nr:cyanoexosortase A [Aetokthonos hydrillicola]MBO3458906.1 cyanoexosortase A [Aetokthonos hydrillicola CCALA 1050]MBW4587245.1 cyanoexosortase A [Aetokthonos hydrillicola CCALA 1050]MDR9896732.1 cyanoexosortase A [Aetokthonos hydrillicola Thurmond2011]
MNWYLPGQLKSSWFWLSAIAVGLILIQLDLTYKILGKVDSVIISALFWLAISYLIWNKRHTLNLQSNVFSTFCGLLIIIFILVKSQSLFWYESFFVKLSALLSFLCWSLLASGISGLKQYKQEFIILLILVSEQQIITLISEKIDISILAAKFSTFLLWYLGFQVSRQGINVILPTGEIQIYSGCSGLNAIVLLLQLALVFILVFPINFLNKILVPLVAIFLAFIINVFRLALMVLLVASSNKEAFEFWHGQPGNEVFSTLSILAFGYFCHFILRENHLEVIRR